MIAPALPEVRSENLETPTDNSDRVVNPRAPTEEDTHNVTELDAKITTDHVTDAPRITSMNVKSAHNLTPSDTNIHHNDYVFNNDKSTLEEEKDNAHNFISPGTNIYHGHDAANNNEKYTASQEKYDAPNLRSPDTSIHQTLSSMSILESSLLHAIAITSPLHPSTSAPATTVPKFSLPNAATVAEGIEKNRRNEQRRKRYREEREEAQHHHVILESRRVKDRARYAGLHEDEKERRNATRRQRYRKQVVDEQVRLEGDRGRKNSEELVKKRDLRREKERQRYGNMDEDIKKDRNERRARMARERYRKLSVDDLENRNKKRRDRAAVVRKGKTDNFLNEDERIVEA